MDGDKLADIFSIADEYGNKDRIYYFASTSKITFPGGGVAMMAMSENNRRPTLQALGAETIGVDKLNQLRHLAFFGSSENMYSHMQKLGSVIKEKFDITLGNLSTLLGLGIASWTEPLGGYFVLLDVLPGTARRVYELMKGAGVVLTPPGATHPYGRDPEDKTLRIAPTYPANSELDTATKILALAVKIAALEKIQ
jgi:DNA-binding transcriptional MocR family regulator